MISYPTFLEWGRRIFSIGLEIKQCLAVRSARGYRNERLWMRPGSMWIVAPSCNTKKLFRFCSNGKNPNNRGSLSRCYLLSFRLHGTLALMRAKKSVWYSYTLWIFHSDRKKDKQKSHIAGEKFRVFTSVLLKTFAFSFPKTYFIYFNISFNNTPYNSSLSFYIYLLISLYLFIFSNY